MKKVFISYAFEDQEAQYHVNFLQTRLPLLGFGVVDYQNQILVGNDFKHAISESINICSIFICFVNRNNPNVMFELGYALGKNKKIIVIGDYRDMPMDVSTMAFIQRGSDPYEILSYLDKYINSSDYIESSLEFPTNDINKNLDILISCPEMLDNLNYKDFENLIISWFKMKGYNTGSCNYSLDKGYDFMISPFEGSSAIVEVKKYKSTSKVPNSVVRQLIGSMTQEKISNGIIISNVPFTESAVHFASDIEQKLMLWTLEDLRNMI